MNFKIILIIEIIILSSGLILNYIIPQFIKTGCEDIQINSIYDFNKIFKIIKSKVSYESTKDGINPMYSLITGKGDCYNYAKILEHEFNDRGIENYLNLMDLNNDGIDDHVRNIFWYEGDKYLVDLSTDSELYVFDKITTFKVYSDMRVEE